MAPRIRIGLLFVLATATLACPPMYVAGPGPDNAKPDGTRPPTVKQADNTASSGDWETALLQYREALRTKPDDAAIKKKIAEAEPRVVDIWTRRGAEANQAGRLGEAGGFWRRALELTPEPNRKGTEAWSLVEQNTSAMEYFGDSAAAEDRHEEAMEAFSALILVHPERVELTEKFQAAKRQFASQLIDEADTLVKRDLMGAALVVDMRALQYDPMQPRAFGLGAELKKTLRRRARVDLAAVKVEDTGFKGLAAPLTAKLTPKLDDFPPYGPAKDAVLKANFRVTVELFAKDEVKEEGVDELPNQLPQPTEPVPNPEVASQKDKVVKLEKRLVELQAKLKAEISSKKKGGKKPGPKPAPTPAAKPGEPVDPGLQLARDVDKTRVDIASAKAKLLQLPLTVPPPPLDPTWKLPWIKTTRWVEARIRFEVQEPDFAELLVGSSVQRIERSDKEHKGNEKQGMAPDKLDLPDYEDLVTELSEKLAAEGIVIVDQARNRRIKSLIDRGHEQVKAGNTTEALDAYMQLLFMVGPDALPGEAATFLAKSLEHDRFKEIVAIQ